MYEDRPSSREPLARRAFPHWRGTEFALFVVATMLAMQGAGCVAGGAGRPRLPVPAEFRAELSRLVGEGKLAEATALLREANPELLARAASEKADVRYMQVMGLGPVTPGIAPRPAGAPPIRTWVVPGTSDVRKGKDDDRYQLAAYDFAKAYNEALAREEKGVR